MAGKTMPWFKLYAEARTDKKLAILTLAERGVWVNLLCYASQQETRGAFDASDRYDLALECADGDEDMLNGTLAKLLKVKHLVLVPEVEGYMTFRTFEERQKVKPSDTRDAMRERKQKQRARGHAQSPDVTPTSRHVTRDNAKNANVTRLDLERERDLDEEISLNGKGNTTAEAESVVVADSSLCADLARAAGLGTTQENLRKLIARHGTLGRDGLLVEAAKAAEWIGEHPKRSMSFRFLDNWLAKAAQPRQSAQSVTVGSDRPEPGNLPVRMQATSPFAAPAKLA